MLIVLGSIMVMVLVFIGFIPAILSELWSLFKFLFFDYTTLIWICIILSPLIIFLIKSWKNSNQDIDKNNKK